MGVPWHVEWQRGVYITSERGTFKGMSPNREMEDSTAESINQWYSRATAACAPFLFPESRFRTPWTADDLPAAVEAARAWHRENPCPDPSLDEHLDAILDAYIEMSNATVSRVMEIRESIQVHAKALDRRRKPRDRPSVAS
jgi:hypothetical protein